MQRTVYDPKASEFLTTVSMELTTIVVRASVAAFQHFKFIGIYQRTVKHSATLIEARNFIANVEQHA